MISFKQLLSDTAKAIVEFPDEVTVIESVDENGDIKLTLSVAPSDMGKVIGRHGRIAKAIRTLIKAAANSESKRVSVEIQ